jgi:hypothetical protein
MACSSSYTFPNGAFRIPGHSESLSGLTTIPIRLSLCLPHRGPESVQTRNLDESIVTLVAKHTEHTEMVRYSPIGDPINWELGEPYIPIGMLSMPVPERLRIDVR